MATKIGEDRDLHLAELPFRPGEKVEVIVRYPEADRPDYPYAPNYGRFPSEETALEAIVRRLVDALKPFRIYLFGSRAEGRARLDSDFDLVVVLDLDIGCDVIPCRWSEFQEVLRDAKNPMTDLLEEARRFLAVSPGT